MTIEHAFPVDGEYVIKLRMWRNTFDLMRGMEDPHDIEIAMDGARLTVVTAGGRDDFGRMAENPGHVWRRSRSPPDRAAPGQGGHAHDLGDDGAQEPGAARRSDQAVHPDDGRRPRHHGRSVGGSHHDRRPVRRGGARRYGVATKDPAVPPDAPRAGNGLRAADPDDARPAGVSQAGGSGDGRRADGLLRARAEETAISNAGSSRHCSSSSRARSSCSASSPIPPVGKRRRSTGLATSRWRRASRSSCGAAFPTSR